MLRFTCPHCSRTFEVPESTAGQISPCPLCGKAVQVPGVSQGVNMAAPPTTPGTLPTGPAAERTSGMAVASLICGLLMCVFPASIAAVILGIIALNQISNPVRRLSGRGLAVAGIILGALGCTLVPLALLIGIMLPALSAARTTARQMQNSTHLRGIHQGEVFFAQANNRWFTGYDRVGESDYAHVFSGPGQDPAWLSFDSTTTYDTSDPRSPSWRFRRLLENNYFTGEYAVSPSETKPYWYPGSDMDPTMFSYSMLQIDGTVTAGLNDLDLFVCPRKAEHRETNNSEAVILADRCISMAGGGLRSVHTNPSNSGAVDWKGSVCWNDNHVTFEPSFNLYTKYNTYVTTSDNLFADGDSESACAEAAMTWMNAQGPYVSRQ